MSWLTELVDELVYMLLNQRGLIATRWFNLAAIVHNGKAIYLGRGEQI